MSNPTTATRDGDDRTPLVPPVRRWQCCHCGGTGLTGDGDTCPHCDGFGHN